MFWTEPTLVGCWRAVPWRDIPLFEPFHLTHPSVMVPRPVRHDAFIMAAGDESPGGRFPQVRLYATDFAWGECMARVYAERGDRRVKAALVRLELVSALLVWIVRVARRMPATK